MDQLPVLQGQQPVGTLAPVTGSNPVAEMGAEVKAMQEDWSRCAALLGGTNAMRSAAKTYLPQFPNEPDDNYKKRLAVSVLFPAYLRTVDTLAGKPFSKAITVSEDLSPKLKDYLDDVDGKGQNLHAFSRSVFHTGLGFGLGGILVDWPAVKRAPGAPPLSQADEKAMNLRPYFVQIRPTQLLDCQVARVGAKWVVTMLRFKECVDKPSTSKYVTKSVEQIRVITPTYWEVHQLNERQQWEQVDQGVNTSGVVTFAPVVCGRQLGYLRTTPPLLEVAHLNIAHWQSASDQQHILHVARVPILCATGVEDTYKLVVGAGVATKMPMGADLKYVEHTGAAIEAGAADLKDLEQRMRQAGAELLVMDQKGGNTRIEAAGDSEVTQCALQMMAEAFEDSLDMAIGYMALWAKEEAPKPGAVTLFKDFGVSTLAEATAALLMGMNTAGKMSDETLWEEMQRRGIVAADRTWEEEKARIEEQGPSLADQALMVEMQALKAGKLNEPEPKGPKE